MTRVLLDREAITSDCHAATLDRYVTTPGVTIRPREFGSVDGLVFLDKEKKHPSFYGKVVKFFEAHGYTRGCHSLRSFCLCLCGHIAVQHTPPR